MCNRIKLKKILGEMVHIYQNIYQERISEIYLYGSYARGDYTIESDIDIVAIVEGSREELQKQLKEIWEASAEIELEYGVIVSPTVIPYHEFECYKDILPYYRNIDREGVKLSA